MRTAWPAPSSPPRCAGCDAVAPATLRAGEDYLAGTELPASLRRLLADQLDDLRRTLQVRSGAA